MASTEQVVQVIKPMPLSASAATPDVRVGGSTPAEAFDVWDFDAAADEYLDFLCRLIGYDAGGLTFHVAHMASSATSGSFRCGIAIRRLVDDAEDIDGSHTYDFNTAGFTVADLSGEQAYDTITFTDGADMDSWAEGELAIVRFFRDGDGTSGTDDATGDMELVDLWGTET